MSIIDYGKLATVQNMSITGAEKSVHPFLKMYLREMGATELLSPDEEKKLFVQRDTCLEYMLELAMVKAPAKHGKKNQNIPQNELINMAIEWVPVDERKKAVLRDYADNQRGKGDWQARVSKAEKKYLKIRDTVITSNVRLLTKVVKWYGKNDGCGRIHIPDMVDPRDVLQEGFGGLIHAFHKFNLSRGYKFSTYAHTWIYQSMNRYLESQSGGNIRLPFHMTGRIKNINRLISDIENESGKSFDGNYDFFYEAICSKSDLSPAQIKEALLCRDNMAQHSLNHVDDDSESKESNLTDFMEVVPSTGGDGMELIERAEIKGTINEMLAHTHWRTSKIFELRFGLNGQKPLTLLETGQKLGLSRERIRQIEMEAMPKMKNYLIRHGIDPSVFSSFV
jgi:RNA polymerase sigma factor (sigma-70 family)